MGRGAVCRYIFSGIERMVMMMMVMMRRIMMLITTVTTMTIDYYDDHGNGDYYHSYEHGDDCGPI